MFGFIVSNAQVQVTYGPMLENDRDNTMNRMIPGDDNSYYCYRVRWKGRGTDYNIEKYDSKTMKLIFSKQVNLEDEDDYFVEGIEYANSNVYIFRRHYDKNLDQMELSYQTISSQGIVSASPKSIVTLSSDHYEFIDFEIYLNATKDKFLVKACHKPEKASIYKTDFILLDAKANLNLIWTKTVKKKLFNSNKSSFGYSFFGFGGDSDPYGFLGLMLDENDNLYFSYLEEAEKTKGRDYKYSLYLSIIDANKFDEERVNLPFDDNYLVNDIEFSKTQNNEIVIGGFLKDIVERRGRDLVNCGIFSFTVNLASKSVSTKAIKIFSPKLLTDLESSVRRSRYFKYKLDYIIPIGSDVYYIGEQYNEQYVYNYNPNGVSTSYWAYEYMDIIVAKLNAKGDFEWISNAPLRNVMRMPYAHVFKQYIAVTNGSNIFVFRNDHPKNMRLYEERSFDPRDLKSVSGIHGSNFIVSTISTTNGEVKNDLVFENEKYCFAPIQERNPQFVPPSSCEIFVPSGNNEIVLYTEDRGRDRFVKIKFE